jgi:predicted phage gp36 major capsid-like protein
MDKARLGLARRGLARLGLGSAWQGLARQARQARRGWARHGVAGRGMELKEVAMDNERKDDGLDVAWREFDAAVERLRRAVCDLESVLGRTDKEE